jgi:enhancing lycopene biosynthesis protein 2
VVLSGCGVYDGSEVHEAAAALAGLTKRGFEPLICAPDKPQAHVVDHATGKEETDGKRLSNILSFFKYLP